MFLASAEEYPVVVAARWYEEHPEEVSRTFAEDLRTYLVNGFVLSTPFLFIMARPVRHDAPYADILNPYFCFPSGERDCWHVFLAAGDISRIWDYYPVDYPWAHWVNRGVEYIQPMERARRLISGMQVDTSFSLA